jgi:tellurite resistance protein TerC
MIWAWIIFICFILAMLALDLGVFHRNSHVVSVREAIKWSAVWVTLGVSFAIYVYFAYEGQWFGLGIRPDPVDGVINDGASAAEKYLTGYVVEKSLSVDNIFVIAMIFGFFAVPAIYQHRVLFWGVLGALLMRGAMIGIGAALITRFHWVLYIFAAILIITGLRMLFMKDQEVDPEHNFMMRLTRRFFRVTKHYHGPHFLMRGGTPTPVADAAIQAAPHGALMLTPLALALVMVETTDLIFAVDSIPAIFAITGDAFLVFTSNVFAILGLRSLYFALAGLVQKFRYLKTALAMVLLVVGAKMLAASWLKDVVGKHFNLYLLGLILLILAGGVLASLWADRRDSRGRDRPPRRSRPLPQRPRRRSLKR